MNIIGVFGAVIDAYSSFMARALTLWFSHIA